VDVRLPEYQVQLLLAEVFVDHRESEDMKCEVPCRIPGVFPLVGHRYDVRVVHVVPMVITGGSASGFERVCAMFFKPLVDIVIVELLRHSIPASAWRMTLASSVFSDDGMTDA